MFVMENPPLRRPSQSVVLALAAATGTLSGTSLHRLANLLEALGSTEPLTCPAPSGLEPVGREILDRFRGLLSQTAVDHWDVDLHRTLTSQPGVGFVTVLDDTYPLNLRQIRDKPCLLFHRGPIQAAAERAIAVIGARQPSPKGIAQAHRLARELARSGTVVVSGLATGIDTAAHEAALEAGGPTVAVLGHGILSPLYPAENRRLAERIVEAGGVLVSQFLPEQPPTRETFPARNVTTSGLSLGTVVIEGGDTSGARQQASRCLKHGKCLFLPRHLVDHEDWARRYADRPGVVVLNDVIEVIPRLEALLPVQKPVQLAFG
jgi:DNA processing protein